jgi:hypothetical protein
LKRMTTPVPLITEAVKLAAIDAMSAQASSVGSHLKGAHRHAAIVRAALRKAGAYAIMAEVDEAALVAYLKERLL